MTAIPKSDLSVEAPGEGLLAAFKGARPAAPAWFEAALARAPHRSVFEAAGAQLELLAWGEPGAPGLLLLHGNGAHADWWAPIAPAFADRYRVAAISWSGMGGSAWRPAYTMSQFVEELLAGAEAAGLFAAAQNPILVGHSFGGFPTLAAAARHGARFAAAISVDSPIFPPGAPDEGPPTRTGPNRIYPTFEAALARFRLAPPQPCANAYYVDHIARGSLKAVDGGFTWRFDPALWSRFEPGDGRALPAAAGCRLGAIWGADSVLCRPDVIAYMRTLYLAGAPFRAIKHAQHHVMLDQPQAFIAALDEMIAELCR
jgi:pimeloyl-ACP methyl ester carboxylesterase